MQFPSPQKIFVLKNDPFFFAQHFIPLLCEDQLGNLRRHKLTVSY